MKKIDMHVHTVPTDRDSAFEFCLEQLIKYVETLSIDAIAITNHNCFDSLQYCLIKESLQTTIVFPGIEVNLESGHILVVAPLELLDTFEEACEKVKESVAEGEDKITIDDFFKIFKDLEQYLVIPHYDKEPSISPTTLERLQSYIESGEVQSPKKFERRKKEEGLTPVLFSDWRPSRITDTYSSNELPARQTYINCDDLTIAKIKYALKDKKNVTLVPDGRDALFEISANGAIASTGLNVVLGKRSSGKSYTLNSIYESFPADNVKFIKQFSLINKSDDEIFAQTIEREHDEFTISYFAELKALLEEMTSYDWEQNLIDLSQYVNSLKEYAANKQKEDIYSKVYLFTETAFTWVDLAPLQRLIEALITILDSEAFADRIGSWLNRSSIVGLCHELVRQLREQVLENRLIEQTNELIVHIKRSLGRRSALNPIDDADFKAQFKMLSIEDRFNSLIHTGSRSRVVESRQLHGFFVEAEVSKITMANELNKACKIRNTSTLMYEALSPFMFYRRLEKERDTLNLSLDLIHRAFWKLKYTVKNAFNGELSGGEKAEYNLLAELEDASKYDLVLIDEPESSFDNKFLKEGVLQSIKELACKSTVFVVTHNNTIGVLLEPDFVVYTEKTMADNEPVFRIYSGSLTSKKLKSSDGLEIDNYLSLMETMEAGEEAYLKRRGVYEALKN